jgi:flagellar basal-body rod protein FlgB
VGIGNLPLFSALSQKMHWHQVRQNVLSENVANAELPGYRGKDLKEFQIDSHVPGSSTQRLGTTTTTTQHIATLSARSNPISVEAEYGYELTPEGNSVGLEEEMMKVAGNQMDYMAVTSLYSRSIKILKTAIGRSA